MLQLRPKARRKLIERLEKRRGSRVIAIVNSIRDYGAERIAHSLLPWLADQLVRIGHVDLLDVFLVTLGGGPDVAYRVVTMCREHCKRLAVLVAGPAASAGTLICLGPMR